MVELLIYYDYYGLSCCEVNVMGFWVGDYF